MRLDDLLGVLRDEFAQSADDIDGALMAWLAEGSAQAEAQATAIGAQLDRLAQTSRILSLEGLALALEMVRDSVHMLALLDDDTMGQGLGWLASWRGPMQACFDRPGEPVVADELTQWLRQGPLSPSGESMAELLQRLSQAPSLAVSDQPQALPLATLDDVSLAVPDDVAPDLFESFLADAPEQLARLGDAVRALGRGGLSSAALQEAQRVAHTFKGSGNIIGVRGVGRLAHRIEDLIEFAAEQGGRLPAPMAHDLERATATLDQMIFALRGEEETPLDAQERLQSLLDWVSAIHDDGWQALVEERQQGRPAESASTAVSTPVAAAPLPVAQPAATEVVETEPQLRVGVGRLDRLVRRAGQALVQGARVGEQVRALDQRLQAMRHNGVLLQQRLRELQVALERQGVTLQEKAQDDAAGFDPLEMDRYNQLHTLSRFVAELVDDERELAQAALDQTAAASVALRDHGQALRDQHRELLGARLVPLRNIVSRLRRTVAQTAATLGRPVRLEVVGDQVQLDSDVLERLTEPLLHLLRNAVDHGIEPPEERALYGKPEEGCIVLHCSRDGQTVHLECRDDGRGLDLGAVHARAVELGLVSATVEPTAAALMRLILLPGFSTRSQVTEVSGRGVGLDVVAERLRAMKGHLDIDSQPLAGTTFRLRVPATTGSVHALIVEAGGERFALPTESVVSALAPGQGEWIDGRLRHAGHDHVHARLADRLRLPDSDTPLEQRPIVLVRSQGEVVALTVDAVVDARELILQDVGSLLRHVPGLAAGALRADGRVLFVLDPEPLAAVVGPIDRGAADALRRRSRVKRKRVLVVDDAISVRKALTQLMQDAGYVVLQARDGYDALQLLARETVDLVLTDLEMPNLNGLDLTRQLRTQPASQHLPIVMITSRATDKHRGAALEAGVSQYLTKPYTDADLLNHVRVLMGG